MRRFPVCACSTAHLPRAENDAIDRLIQHAPRRSGRIIVNHPILSIEAHQYGFWVHLASSMTGPIAPMGFRLNSGLCCRTPARLERIG
ncbi:hypothetical protein [Sphingobium sp. Ant17]|uniref:hypothetical protein n=1 Tax=Sphingobium sp. Ant17 TaxID=1461752 RepID=UPI0004B9F341|nr:hypothetical protein [Sphingobium sp. Ant17]